MWHVLIDQNPSDMPWKQLIGTRAETYVKEWLAKKGFRLIRLNWHCSYGEIDIIASLFGQLHFISVATKNSNGLKLPVEGMTRKKMLCCKQVAQKYLEKYPEWKKIVFDIMAIDNIRENEPKEIVLIENIRTV